MDGRVEARGVEIERSVEIDRDIEGFNYVPISSAKKCLIHRTPPQPKGGAVVGFVKMDYGIKVDAEVQAKELEGVMEKVDQLEDDRGKAQEVLGNCNDKLEDLIEKSRNYEAENKFLIVELRALRQQWGKETQKIREDGDVLLARLRTELLMCENVTVELSVQVESFESVLGYLREGIDDESIKRDLSVDFLMQQNKLLFNMEKEMEGNVHRMKQLEIEKERWSEDIEKFPDQIKKLQEDLEQITIVHVKTENAVHTLQETLDFLKLVWDLEKKELELLIKRDLSPESRGFWKSEISNLIRLLQDEFDSHIDTYVPELTAFFEAKVAKIQPEGPTSETGEVEELTHLRPQVDDARVRYESMKDEVAELEQEVYELGLEVQHLARILEDERQKYESESEKLNATLSISRREIERLSQELRRILDQKIELEVEVSQYNRMIELESSRGGAGRLTKGKGVMSARTVPERKILSGQVEIIEISKDARCITICNHGDKEVHLEGWSLVRKLDDGARSHEFRFGKVSLKGKQTIRIFAKGARPGNAINDLEFEKTSWGLGASTSTHLFDKGGVELTWFKTKTVYSTD